MASRLHRREFLQSVAVGGTLGLAAWEASAEEQGVPLSNDYVRRRAQEQDASTNLSAEVERLFPGLELCWLVPPHTLLVRERRKRWMYLRGDEFTLRSAEFQSQLTGSQALELSQAFPDAVCDPSQEWFAYRTAHAVREKTKVFALPLSATGIKVGMYRGSVPAEVLNRDYAPFDASRARAEGLLNAGRDRRFVLHARYAEGDEVLREMGISLYAKDWTRIATQHWALRANSGWCDGCAMPKLVDGLGPVFGAFNMIAHPELAHPLLLLDQSTVESRVLGMATFLGDGRFARATRSHYVIGCPSFERFAH